MNHILNRFLIVLLACFAFIAPSYAMDCKESLVAEINSGYKVSNFVYITTASGVSKEKLEAVQKALDIKLEKQSIQELEFRSKDYKGITLVIKVDGCKIYEKTFR
jgi:hypothetical protein